jgi:hypothetical protein
VHFTLKDCLHSRASPAVLKKKDIRIMQIFIHIKEPEYVKLYITAQDWK